MFVIYYDQSDKDEDDVEDPPIFCEMLPLAVPMLRSLRHVSVSVSPPSRHQKRGGLGTDVRIVSS